MNIAQPVLDAGPCQHCGVRKNAICRVLDVHRELPEMGKSVRHRHYAAGHVIMSDQDPVSFLGTVLEGTVKLEKMMGDGRKQILGLLFPSDFLGRAHAKQSPYYAIALEPVKLCYAEAASFHRLLETFPKLETSLFERTLEALDHSREWMMLLGRKTARERVASFLCLLAERQAGPVTEGEPASDGPLVCRIPLTRGDIAEFLGLTMETVSRQIGELKSTGLIVPDSTRQVTIPSLSALREAAEKG
ncbi:Crp/Fnr family transcriptional regulator [Marinibaculum pumilum]|uniref:Crp/Fnr family transcriptional regulator n=1 Tax=Marinibaculum pumilum TaxID=1766165 RepID=A0ABV7KWF3_9PROT